MLWRHPSRRCRKPAARAGGNGPPRRPPRARATAPEGECTKHREAVRALTAQAVLAHASLEALKQDQAGLDAIRDQLREAHAGILASRGQSETLQADVEQLRSLSEQLSQDFGKLKDLSRETHEETTATVELV